MSHGIMKSCVTFLLVGTALVATSAFATDANTQAKPTTAQAQTKAQQKTQPRKVGSYALNRFNKLDVNKDGRISKTEFTNAHAMAFDKKDKNKDGFLSKAEASPTLAKQLKKG